MRTFLTSTGSAAMRVCAGLGIFLVGALLVHTVVMLIDRFTYDTSLDGTTQSDFIGHLFSLSMVPMMMAYGLLSLVAFYLWRRMKRAIEVVYEHEVQVTKQRTVLETAQRLTAITVELIAANNSEILNWLELKKINGHQVPEKLEMATRNIGEGLRALSEVSFATSYYDEDQRNVEDYMRRLEVKLKENTHGLGEEAGQKMATNADEGNENVI